DKTLKIWDMHSGVERLTLSGHSGGVNGCAISPTGDFIVSASFDETLKIWDAHSGVERLTLIGHTNGVNGCAISPTGDFIASTSNDKTIKLWDAHSGICLTTLSFDNFLTACTFCPDGIHIVAVGDSGVYYLQLIV
ncbi:MAG: WD40 repeat domain-containing protein, partial [Ktedonobacteraceae bacterium]